MDTVEVFTKITVEGVHKWEGCPIEEMSYLKNLHRHNFGIKMFMNVSDMDLTDNFRKTEFIYVGHKIKNFLHSKFWDEKLQLLNFGNMSVENIGKLLIDNFITDYRVTRIEVNEDNECGCVITI